MLQILKIKADKSFYVDYCLHCFCIILQCKDAKKGEDLYSILSYSLGV